MCMKKIFTFFFFYFALTFTLKAQTISFTYANLNGGGFCSPSSISFTPVYTGTPIGFTWDFGNGQTSNSSIPVVSFTAGTYIVKLIAVFQNAPIETSQTITVAPSFTVNLTSNVNGLCSPGLVKFKASSTLSNVSYIFDFGDGTPPVSSLIDSVAHTYTSFGSFTAKVRATSGAGCLDSAFRTINIRAIELNGFNTPVQGCKNLNVAFSIQANLPQNVTVLNYTWFLGNTSPSQINQNSNFNYTYTDTGTFLPFVVVNTSVGCADTFRFNEVKVGMPPFGTIANSNKTEYCGNETPKFYAFATLANSYRWDYGDGAIETVTDTTALHKYSTLGVKTVSVTPLFNGCPGTPVVFNILIKGVIAKFVYANTCQNKNRFTFVNQTQGNISTSVWNFGDNTPSLSSINAIHSFPLNGSFNTELIVGDNITGCKDTIAATLFTATPSLVTPKTFLCRNDATSFSINNNYSNLSLQGTWFVVGQFLPYLQSTQNVVASNFGNFSNNYVILNNGDQYCRDTVRYVGTVSVRGPDVNYIASSIGCANNNFVVNNVSFPFLATDTIKNWQWNFGLPGLTDNNFQPLPFIYPAEGTYDISLTATDINGCTASKNSQVLVRESPFLRIFPRSAEVCSGKVLTLEAYHTDTLLWTSSNLVTCNTCDTTTTIALDTTVTIFATASNALGCTLRDSMTVKVFRPFTAAPTNNSLFGCKGDTVLLEVLPYNKRVVWSPIEGLTVSNFNKTKAVILKDSITYTALLTDSLACYSSSTNLKVIAHPSPTVNAGPDRVLAYNSPFTITPVYGNSVTSYQWLPAGNLSCTNCANPSGFADSLRSYTIKTSNAFGCKASDNIVISVACASANLYMASAFSPNSNNNNLYFPQTRGIKIIDNFSVYNRFGELVYTVRNAQPNLRNLGWNGKYKGIEQPLAGYVYQLTATCELGEKLTKNGSFLLLR
jgi:PKD repeat protein